MKNLIIISVAFLAISAVTILADDGDDISTTPIPTECPKKDPKNRTINIAHESNCSLFYTCERGRKILQICPLMDEEGNRLYFNPLLQVCDWPENVNCTNQGEDNGEEDNGEDENNEENNNQDDENEGDEDKGDENKGDENKGDENKGDENKGDENKGDENKGDENKGDANKGDANKGDENKEDEEVEENENSGDNGNNENEKDNESSRKPDEVIPKLDIWSNSVMKRLLENQL